MAGMIREGATHASDMGWFERKFGGKSDAWRAGFVGWDQIGELSVPNPYEASDPRHAEYMEGGLEAAFWYDERQAERKESRF